MFSRHAVGQRVGSACYFLNGFKFYKNKEKNGKVYYNCSQKFKGCKATASSEVNNSNLVPVEESHNHSTDSKQEEAKELIKTIVDDCIASPRQTIHAVFNKHMAKIDDGELIQLVTVKKVRDQLRYKMARPPRPDSLYHAARLLEENGRWGRTSLDEEELYRGSCGTAADTSLIFASNRMLSICNSGDTFAADGTFYSVPNVPGGKQIFILAVFQFGQVWPLALIIMGSKSQVAYQAVMEKLRDLGIKPKKMITDWEPAQRNAWRKIFKAIDIWGCIWHFQRTL
ncbi:uncharacterized protein LOC117653084 isoform X2 [Thrips palmi]|uniref:Uncharacterized protein LOC117653084 isoform X2 n=1 Tax=Thrips palmi TaxID=161013 RepID=A0A6P9A8I8_THRPL|nr:uncharacterized protein LOC117653084 isoform X2 [Thrips palmi]